MHVCNMYVSMYVIVSVCMHLFLAPQTDQLLLGKFVLLLPEPLDALEAGRELQIHALAASSASVSALTRGHIPGPPQVEKIMASLATFLGYGLFFLHTFRVQV